MESNSYSGLVEFKLGTKIYFTVVFPGQHHKGLPLDYLNNTFLFQRDAAFYSPPIVVFTSIIDDSFVWESLFSILEAEFPYYICDDKMVRNAVHKYFYYS